MYMSPALNIQNMHDLSEKRYRYFPSFRHYKDVFNKIELKFKMPYKDTCKICEINKNRKKYMVKN